MDTLELTREQEQAAETLALSYESVCVHRPVSAHNFIVVEATTAQETMNFTTKAHRVDTFRVCDTGECYRERPDGVGAPYPVDPARPTIQLTF